MLKTTAGEAYDIVKTSPLTDEGFEIAWLSLTDMKINVFW